MISVGCASWSQNTAFSSRASVPSSKGTLKSGAATCSILPNISFSASPFNSSSGRLPYSGFVFGDQSVKGAFRSEKAVCNAGNVVTIGEALYDCLADQLGRSKEEVTSWTPYPGGAPANVATALARLGLHTIFLSAIGQDDLGEEFINLLKSRNVNIEFIQRNNYPTRDVLVTRSLDGDREFAGFGAAETDQYSDCYMDPDQIPEKVIQESDVLITGTLGLAYAGSGNSIRKAVENAEKGDCIVVIDVNWRPVFWQDANDAKKIIEDFVNHADILKVTDEEAEWLFGIPAGEAVSHPEKVLGCIPHASGVLVSAGEKGSSYAFKSPEGDKDLTGTVPVLPVKVADTTGAGDAYLSGFVFFLLQNGGMGGLMTDPDKVRRAVEFATGCGAFTCTNPGAIDSQPTVLDVESLLSDYGWNK